MIDKLLELAREAGLLDVTIEHEGELTLSEALRLFAMNVDIKPVLELLKRFDGPGLEEILEELDVDTCEPDFVYFFLTDVMEEVDKDFVVSAFESLKQRGLVEAVVGVGLLLLLLKALGDEKKLEEVFRWWGPPGFEPGTSGSGGPRSTRLSYGPF